MPKGIFKRKPFSEEHKKKISLSKLGKKIGPFSEETKQKMRKPKSEEHKIKLSESKMGDKNPMKKLENRIKNSEARKGPKSKFWIDGRTKEKYPYAEMWGEPLREQIRERDNYTCKICNLQQCNMDGFYKRLSVHHIDYNKTNCNSNNLVSLCPSCHSKTNVDREKWIEYFNKKLIIE